MKPPGGSPFGGKPTGNAWRRVKREPDRVYRIVRNAAGKLEARVDSFLVGRKDASVIKLPGRRRTLAGIR